MLRSYVHRIQETQEVIVIQVVRVILWSAQIPHRHILRVDDGLSRLNIAIRLWMGIFEIFAMSVVSRVVASI